MNKKTVFVGLLLCLTLAATAAQPTLFGVSGRVNYGGRPFSGNLTASVSSDANCHDGPGVFYSRTFPNAIANGVFSVTFGEDGLLSLDYNRDYWLCTYANGNRLGSGFRFRGGQGQLNNLTSQSNVHIIPGAGTVFVSGNVSVSGKLALGAGAISETAIASEGVLCRLSEDQVVLGSWKFAKPVSLNNTQLNEEKLLQLYSQQSTVAGLVAHTNNLSNPHAVTLTQAEAAGGQIREASVRNDNLLARVADDENITGQWVFSRGITADGTVFDANTLTPLQAHASNRSNPHRVSLTQAEQVGGQIGEASVRNDALLARVADNENITGRWTFLQAIRVGATDLSESNLLELYSHPDAIANLQAHASNRSNPHRVSLTQAEQVGGQIGEASVRNGVLLARVGDAEVITGPWSFVQPIRFNNTALDESRVKAIEAQAARVAQLEATIAQYETRLQNIEARLQTLENSGGGGGGSDPTLLSRVTALERHAGNQSNPHRVTLAQAEQVGGQISEASIKDENLLARIHAPERIVGVWEFPYIGVKIGGTQLFDLRFHNGNPGLRTNNTIIFSNAAENGGFGIGPYSLWVDNDGKLRMKRGRPESYSDGQVVGQQ